MKPNLSPFSDWSTKADRHVALFSLVGFDDLLNDSGTNQMEIFESLTGLMEGISPSENFAVHKDGMADMKRTSGQLKIFRFFDKIILVTKDNSETRENLPNQVW